MIELRRRYSGSKGSGSPSFSRLPAGYQEVEYLENVEGAYIRTGITMKRNTLYSSEIDFQWGGKTSGGRMPCIDGFYSGTSAIPNWVSIYIENNSLSSFYKNTNNETINITYNDNSVYNRHKIIFSSDTGSYIDGINISEDKLLTTADYTNDRAFLLFCRGAVDGAYSYEMFLGKIYSAKYYENMVAIREFIPCYRKADDVAGMYDLVSGEFYTNAGTGEFTVGPDVIG